MSVEYWIAFVVASGLFLALPRPAMMLVLSYAIGHGRRTIAATVTGLVLGNVVALSAAVALTAGALLISLDAFTMLKIAGAIYLAVTVFRFWRVPVMPGPMADNDNLPQDQPIRILGHAFAFAAASPGNLAFLVAFLPQFFDARQPFWLQFSVMQATYLVVLALAGIGYAIFAERARSLIRRHKMRKAANRNTGAILIAAGAVTAGYRRAAA